MKKFDVFANIKGEEVQSEKGVEFSNEEEALSYVEYFAYDLYYWNPKRDILEIAKEENVSEEVAGMLFVSEMIDSVEYSVVEVVEA